MAVKYKVKKDRIPEVISSMRSLNGKKVNVGALRGEHAWLAGIHEYGCNIPVTPKMRAFLHSQGLHLRASTQYIRIPERSFIRSGYDENADRILKQTERAIGMVVAGKLSVDDLLNLYGQQMATAIKTYAVRLSDPPNHPFTIDQKGSSNPLVGGSPDSSSMIESIIWKVEG